MYILCHFQALWGHDPVPSPPLDLSKSSSPICCHSCQNRKPTVKPVSIVIQIRAKAGFEPESFLLKGVHTSKYLKTDLSKMLEPRSFSECLMKMMSQIHA